MKEIFNFLKILRIDYKSNSSISKSEKRKCFYKIISGLLSMIWSSITAPFIYPIWYIFRKQITAKVYKGTSIHEIEKLIESNETNLIKQKLKANGLFLYFMWTYGDATDPLGNGGMAVGYKDGKINFKNRYLWSAFRNARFNKNYLDFRTGKITEVSIIIDERNFNYKHKSLGIGDSPDGIYFKWLKDSNGCWYFIFENNNSKHIFYFGYVGFLFEDIGKSGGRLETSLRNTEGSYYC